MNIFDLVFLGSALTVLAMSGWAGYLLLGGRRRDGARVAAGLGVFVGVYALVLVTVSLLSPQRVVAMGETRCFDDWCIEVKGVERRERIGEERASGVFQIVTARVSSRALRVRQRETDLVVYLIDEHGRRFDLSAAGQRALERERLAGPPLTEFVEPGGFFESRVVFETPAEAAGLGFVKASRSGFPGRFIIGDPESFLHRPTIVRLPAIR